MLSPGQSILKIGSSLVYWGLVLMPIIGSVVYAQGLSQIRGNMDNALHEPHRLGETVAVLTRFAGEIEANRQGGSLPSPLKTNKILKSSVDPFRGDGPLQLVKKDGIYRLCSLGPDRVQGNGQGLDRFTGEGDLCLKLGAY